MKKSYGALGARGRSAHGFPLIPSARSAIILLVLLIPRYAFPADALDQKISLNIAPNTPLDQALVKWSAETGVQVMMSADSTAREKTEGLSGTQSARYALVALLHDSGMSYTVEGNTVHVVPTGLTDHPEPKASISSDSPKKARASDGSTRNGARQEDLAEILVTAQKRDERLQDVPVPVTAVSADSLIETDQTRLQDFYSSVPGLNVTPNAQSQQIVSIRGITTGGFTNPTVGITVDDVPYGASTALGGGLIVPDIDPNDLARIEVLRGPQGTLYGASSMGGLIKFVTVEPTTDHLIGQVNMGGVSIHNGDEVGYIARGSVNVPLSDSLAIRASAFTRLDPGYINVPQFLLDPGSSKKGVNRDRATGGRLAALWRPSEVFSLRFSALYQEIKGDGSSDVAVPTPGYPQTIGLGDLQQSNLKGTGIYNRKVQAYSVTADAKLGRATLTSVTGYTINSFTDSTDASYLLGFFSETFFNVAGGPILSDNRVGKFTEEVRFALPIGEKIDWLIGAFYADENAHFNQQYAAVDTVSAATVGIGYTSDYPTTDREYAGFTDLTFHLSDTFDVQVGGRESHIKQSYRQTNTGIYVPYLNNGATSPFVAPERDSSANAFTYLVTPRLKLTPDWMLYARLASGYRPGGPNISPGGAVPPSYSPDKTQNYEIGVKGQMLDHRLTIDASVYYIDWKDIQVTLLNRLTFQNYDINGSKAKSQGVELSADARPWSGLSLSAWTVLGEAELTRDFTGNGSVGARGDRLPNSARFSGGVSIKQKFPLGDIGTAFAAASATYVGDRISVFTATPQRQSLPGYARTDVRLGLVKNSWTVIGFVNNLTDRRGALYGGIGAYPPFGFTYIQPRTIGLNVIKSFGE